MENTFYSFEDLVKKATAHLIKIGYSPRSLDRFRKDWFLLAKYMEEESIKEYAPEVGIQFLRTCTGHIDYRHLTPDQKNQIHNINILSDFVATGVIIRGKNRQKVALLEGEIGETMIEFIQSSKKRKNLAPTTVQSYYRSLSVLFNYLSDKGIVSLVEIKRDVIAGFCKSLNDYSHLTKRIILSLTQKFTEYLSRNEYIHDNISEAIVKPRLIKRPKLPSYYSPDEIVQIVNSINKATPEGKRDYCILLLAARLGIRSADIRALKMTNLLWDRSIITFTQIKTGNLVELPLTAEAGNAIINYLKNGRPKTEAKEVFIRHTHPYEGLSKNHIYDICSKYIKKAGVIYDGRRHGLHSFRHSLASHLLEVEVPLSIISRILGHNEISSTRSYLRVDLTSLRKCTLDLPTDRKEVLL